MLRLQLYQLYLLRYLYLLYQILLLLHNIDWGAGRDSILRLRLWGRLRGRRQKDLSESPEGKLSLLYGVCMLQINNHINNNINVHMYSIRGVINSILFIHLCMVAMSLCFRYRKLIDYRYLYVCTTYIQYTHYVVHTVCYCTGTYRHLLLAPNASPTKKYSHQLFVLSTILLVLQTKLKQNGTPHLSSTMPVPVMTEIFYNGLHSVPWAPTVLKIAPYAAALYMLRWYFSGAKNSHERIMNSKVVMVTVGLLL